MNREALKEKNSVEKALLTPDELCVYLNLSITTVYKLMKEDGFPRVKIGRRIFANKSELDYWIQNHKERGTR